MANTLNLGTDGNWGVKKDSLLGYNSENNNYKPLPFSFTRASSATVVNKAGLIETVGSGEPRIDFLGNTKGALLLEPQRTNVNTKSENIQNWSFASNASGEYGYEDPFKGNKAVKLTSTSDAQAYQAYLNSSGLSSGTTYTYSIYAKRGTAYAFLIDFAIPNNGSVIVDLRDGSLISESGVGYIGYNVDALSNGWYRISMVSTFDSSAYFRTGLFNQQGDCYVAFSQLEQGSYATSYIPTQGSAVTRIADACSNENLNVDYSGDYTLYLEHETLSLTEYNQFQFRQETSISYIFRVGNSISVGSGIYSATNTIGFNKFALSVGSDGSYSFYKNGSLLSSGSGLNANLETIKNDALGMSIKDIKLYNTRLSNAELQALTSN